MQYYRLLLSILLPFGLGMAVHRIWRRTETMYDVGERFGIGFAASRSNTPTSRKTLWIHAASNGEVISAKALIEHALRTQPDLKLIITVNSVTARALVQSWALPRTNVRLAPIDLQLVNRRFLEKFKPNALLTLENEIWPNRFVQCAKRDIPILVAGARMSASAAQTWEKYQYILGKTAQKTLSAITFIAPQDPASAERLVHLGVDKTHVLPQMNLKSDVALDVPLLADDAALRSCFKKENTVLAASTHEGEDEIILASFAALRTQKRKRNEPICKFILAPRHPKRATDIEKIAQRYGLKTSLRSKDQSPTSCDVYIADTLGEMALWYALSSVTFVGGSLIDKGGHTPFEPAQFCNAILYGPYVSNHADAFSALTQAHASVLVKDTSSLTQALTAAFADPKQTSERGVRGNDALAALRQDTPASPEFWHALFSALDA